MTQGDGEYKYRLNENANIVEEITTDGVNNTREQPCFPGTQNT